LAATISKTMPAAMKWRLRGLALLLLGAANAAAAASSGILDDAMTDLGRHAYRDAIPLFDNALEDPGLDRGLKRAAYLGRGEAYLGEHLYDSAAADCKQAVDLDGESAAAQNCLGLAYRGLKKLDPAEEALNAAVKLSPDDPVPLVNLGALHDLRRVPHLAIADETAALEITPGLAAALAERAAAHFQLGQYDQTIEDDTRAIQTGLPDPKWLNDRGVAYAAMGRYDLALDDLRRAAGLASDDEVIAANLKLVEAHASQTALPASSALAPAAPPPLAFTRPVLAVVPDIAVPAKFCTEFERNAFLTDKYGPAQAIAKANGDKATQYQRDLNKQYDQRLNAPNDGSDTLDLIRTEMDNYKPIADQAFLTGTAVTKLYDAIMAVPAGGC
jgi:tetratricopeptide (TPR) repeat protein